MYFGQLKKRYSVYVDITLDKVEKANKIAIEVVGVNYKLNPGECAFYGLKLEINKSNKIKFK